MAGVTMNSDTPKPFTKFSLQSKFALMSLTSWPDLRPGYSPACVESDESRVDSVMQPIRTFPYPFTAFRRRERCRRGSRDRREECQRRRGNGAALEGVLSR